jgi:hypothetical protein
MTSSLINKITSINLSSNYTQVSSDEKESSKGWVDYGDRNGFPQYCLELAEQSPVHGSLVRSISQMIAGKGISSKDVGTASLIKSLKIDAAVNNTALDLELHGGFFWQVVWTLGGEISFVEHLPFENCRIGINRESGDINGVWYSNDWSNLKKRRNAPKFIPLFSEKTKKEHPRQVYFCFKNSSTANYYGKPDYISSLNYIELSRQIALFHVNNIQNGLFPSMVVSMNNGIPETQEEMDMVRHDIERNISGAVNAGKFVLMFNENRDRAAEFTPFPITDADKQYQYLEDVCTRQIMIAHRVTSPLLFGIREGGGLGSNKDEMETALKIFNEQVIEPSQRLITDAAETILQAANSSSAVFIVSNGEEVNADAAGVATTTTSSDVTAADVSYNGAQISSAIDIIAKVKEGILTEEQATIFLIQFLQLPEDVAKAFFAGGGAIAVQNLSAHLKKKVATEVCCATESPEFTIEEEDKWLDKLSQLGEIIDEEEWELMSEEEAGGSLEELEYFKGLKNVNMAYGSYANPGEASNWGDSGLYKLRYKYSENISANSRKFCRQMVGDSVRGLVFRYEDIADMSASGVNEQFAAEGQSTYDIFTWKGGAYCHHSWLRRIYFRKRKDGKFLPNKGLKNDERVKDSGLDFLPAKGKESIRPINTPNRGSLKNID